MNAPQRYAIRTLPVSSSLPYIFLPRQVRCYEGWNFNSGNYLFTTDTK